MFDERVYDLKVYKYMKDVKEGKVIACKDLILLCVKLLNDIERSKNDDYEFYFDVNKAIAIDKFIHLLRFTEGHKVGQPIKLANFQELIIKNTFCWREKKDKSITRFNDIIVFLPRKQGKSFICSMLAILAVMLEENAEVLNGAGTESQALILVRQAMRLIRSNPNLSKHFKIYKKYIEFQGSTFAPVANNATAMDGKNPNTILCDEAMIVARALMESLTSGFMQRKSYQAFYISTQYSTDMKTGWLDEMLEYGRKVLNGVLEDERILMIVYKLDSAEEIHNRDLWIKANPILSEIDDSFLREAYKKSLESPAMMKNTLIKNFNVEQAVADDNAYIDMDKWKACRSEEPIDWKGIHVNVGVDLSKTTDLTAVSFTGIDEEGNVLIHSHGFLPEDSLLSGNRREKIDYRKMEQLGYCTINEGGVIDYNIVKEYIMNIEEKFGCIIDSICFDMYNALQMFTELSQEGFNVLEQKQNILSLSYPTKTFREKVYLGQVKYDKNELLDWCVSCAITEEDRNGNEKISKNKSQKNNKRIDMIAAVIFSYAETVKTEIKPKFNIDAFGIIDC
ncbi:terminase large subunit [Clostridium perfringens]|nr:terminase large subunit [Clostridium perfringens]MDK0409053.1 terminase large subunit [Clostridium perfringens]MDK0443312.1 terminase large subunit [Clostridium perfringens]MDK0496856.1 terminase large subunit [Clostridium perfringens]MDK0499962.1 terminase large subunit [Clostridium perfringens]